MIRLPAPYDYFCHFIGFRALSQNRIYRTLFCLFLLCAYYSVWYTCRNHPVGKSWVTTLPGLITESAPMVSPAYIVAFVPIKNFSLNGNRCWGSNFITALLLVKRMVWAIFFSAHCIVKMMINQYIFFPRIPKNFGMRGFLICQNCFDTMVQKIFSKNFLKTP